MNEVTSIPGLLVALVLPWVCGSIWINWLLRGTGRCTIATVLGQGYFLGIFLTTLLIRLWDTLGIGLNFPGIAAGVAVIGVLGLVGQVLRPAPAVARSMPQPLPAWAVAVAALFMALIAWRYFTLLQELLLRPLYAWDAWMNWAPKAIVWFQQGNLVDFVDPQQWLQLGGFEAYTLGNRQASTYPETVPLIQLWSMLGIGTWDHSAIYLPWLLAPLALGLGLFGHLRTAGVPFVLAVIAGYVLLNLPYLNVHSVLAGYADIWLAAAFCLAVCALYEWHTCRHWSYGVLCLILAVMCSQLKEPGIVLAVIILFFAARSWFAIRPGLELSLWLAAIVTVTLVIALGFSLHMPYFGRIALGDGVLEVGRFGRFELAYHPVGGAFLKSAFLMINWSLLWYLLPPYLVYRINQRGLRGLLSPEFLPVLAALGFVVFVFVFSRYYTAALNFVTLNRVLLYPVPALIFCLFLSFQRLAPAARAQPAVHEFRGL
ncbi:MAG: hypothetical protein R3E50_00010 [Halioglobus sp.]